MSSRPLDTSEEAWSEHAAIIEHMGGEKRLQVAMELSDAVRTLRLEGMRARDPAASHEELIRRLIREEYGIELPARR